MRRGDLSRAHKQYAQALAIREKAFPENAYPNGHTDLLRTLMSLGKLMVEQNAAASAVPLYERAHGMANLLYPEVSERSGHAILAWVLHDYGRALMLSGQDRQAFEVLLKAKALFAKGSSPSFLQASTLAALGELHARRGDNEICNTFCVRAREMYEEAYPVSTYEAGHSNLATGLARLARIALLVGDLEAARNLVLRSQSMYRAIAERFFWDSAVMEGLLLRAQLAHLPALFLSIDGGSDGNEAYETVFRTKGAVRRIHSTRAAFVRKGDCIGATEHVAELRRLRADLSRLLYVCPTIGDTLHGVESCSMK